MAEIIKQVDFEVRSTKKYPWNDWANGSCWKLLKGIDYKSSTSQFRANAGTAAYRRDMLIKFTRIDGGCIIQFVEKRKEIHA